MFPVAVTTYCSAFQALASLQHSSGGLDNRQLASVGRCLENMVREYKSWVAANRQKSVVGETRCMEEKKRYREEKKPPTYPKKKKSKKAKVCADASTSTIPEPSTSQRSPSPVDSPPICQPAYSPGQVSEPHGNVDLPWDVCGVIGEAAQSSTIPEDLSAIDELLKSITG